MMQLSSIALHRYLIEANGNHLEYEITNYDRTSASESLSASRGAPDVRFAGWGFITGFD